MSECTGNCKCTSLKICKDKDEEEVRNDEYIDSMLSSLGTIWKQYRDLRFGQFVLNAFEENELYDKEDCGFLSDIEKKYESWS